MQENELSSLNTAVLFTNWTAEDFSCNWGGKKYTFPSRQSLSINAGDHTHNTGLAKHFAKHLTDRELNKRGVPTDHHTRKQFEENCFIELSIEATVPVLEVEIHAETGIVKAVTEIGREEVATGKKTKGAKKKVEIIEEKEVAEVPKATKKPKGDDEFED
jgi:hypothetical protein